MALSDSARERLIVALTDDTVGSEVADAIDSGSNAQGAAVADLGATGDITAAGLSTADTYTDNAVNAELDSLMAEVEARLDDAEAKIDELAGSLRDAGIIAS